MSRPLLQSWARTLLRRAGDCAVIDAATGNAFTFRDIDERAEEWRRRQVNDDTIHGRAVVFAAPNGIGWLEIFLGLAKAGAVIVPVDAGEPAAMQQRIAEQLRARCWWDGGRLRDVGASDLMAAGIAPTRAARRYRNPQTCLIKLTSGTTGLPRPLVFTDSQMLADARQVTTSMGITAADLNYALIPFGHSYGLGNLTLPLLAHGVPLVCGSAPLPQAIADDFARWRPTVFPSVPAVYRALAAASIPPAALASLRLAISAGAPLPPEVAAAFEARFGRRIHAFYGSSETGGISFDRSGAAALAGGVGQPLRGVTIAAINGNRIAVQSAAVFTIANRRSGNGHGRWVPPDNVRVDADGSLTLLGRRGSTVKIAGRRVNLGEVAAALRQVDGVRDAWIGVSGAEPVLGAVVSADRSAADLRAALHAKLALWKIPRKWVVLPNLPVTSRGKPDTRALRQLLDAKS